MMSAHGTEQCHEWTQGPSDLAKGPRRTANHLAELHRFLSRLSFRAHEDKFSCTAADLIRLGKWSDPSITEEAAAPSPGGVLARFFTAGLTADHHWWRTSVQLAG